MYRARKTASFLQLALLALFSIGASCNAAEIASVSPQGEIATVQNVVVRFKAEVARIGDPRLPSPVELRCDGIDVAGTGRWTNEREWIFDFSRPLAAGAKCVVTARADFRPTARGATPGWSGAQQFMFQLSAPTVRQVRPWEGGRIEEDQRFLLQLSGTPRLDTVAPNMWCESKALGERIPVELRPNAERDAALRTVGQRHTDSEIWILVACKRPLPAGADASLVWGPGITGASNAAVRTRGERRLHFSVRPPLTADFSCERERANAPCLPVRPLSVSFSEPIVREQALKVRLKGPGGVSLSPVLPTDQDQDSTNALSSLRFPAPLAEQQDYVLELPPGIKDESGRTLSNAASFPMKIRTAAAPPLAKFAAAPFGIVEWEFKGPSLVPLSMRHVQADLQPRSGGHLRIKRISDDVDILRWYGRLHKQNEWEDRKSEWLKGAADLQSMTVPPPNPDKAIDVIGIPLSQPGYHVLELKSPKLGQSLLDPVQPMFVRTGTLVTNLGLHFKLGKDDSLVWVTSLDGGRPVESAQVSVYDCRGKSLWTGRTDARGLASIDRPNLDADRGRGECIAESGLFITAWLDQPGKPQDMAFMFSGWSRGIEPWRFNVPVAWGSERAARAHTVTDRPLLRAGETVSMKHFFRLETVQGLSDPSADQLPNRLRIQFEGTGEDVASLDLRWEGARYAVSSWKVPADAKLGRYRFVMERSGETSGPRSWDSGGVKVEEFRVPLVDARLIPPKSPAPGAQEQSWAAQLNFMAGGPMAKAATEVSALLQARWAQFPGFEDFVFDPPSAQGPDSGSESDPGDDEAPGGPAGTSRLLLDKLALQTDAKGGIQFKVPLKGTVDRPSELRVELNYRDPDGQTHTRAASQVVWPANVVVGLRAPSWVANGQPLQIQAVALDTNGKPLANQKISVGARQIQTLSTRKRLVGGFYAYEHQRQLKDLGELCNGKTDAMGLMRCEIKLNQGGQVELLGSAADEGGRTARAARSLWVTRAGELWFAQDNDDRIDVIPERRRYEPGETARFQVRMPYREATALITVEREGVLHSEVRRLSGRDPWLDLKIDRNWTPNAYVGVMVLRGRLRDVPWYSFFSWGWREPVNWWREWRASGDYQPPTAMVDLSKPSFKFGMAAIEIGQAKHRLQVEVVPQQPQYGVRQSAQVKLRVTQDGKPVPDAQIAFAAVDEGLLALAPNPSWKLLEGMIQSRAWGVTTATAHSEIIGRRHYGRKAVAAGGGGGFATRELFDTLLAWQPVVKLNAQGEALVQVTLNDSLTRFRLVAVADAPGQRFGTGEGSINVSQDLQLLSGLPPLVREGDRVQAMVTVRNATQRAMDLRVSLKGQASLEAGEQPVPTEARLVKLAAGAAQEVGWDIVIPEGAQRIVWEAQAEEQGGARAKDAMRTTQAVQAAVPLRVLQATLRQLDGPLSLPVAAPADALPAQGVKRGGLQIGLQPRLSSALPGVRRYFEQYPFTCLEQQSSRFIALHDDAAWAGLMGQLSSYQDSDGLFAYFPLSRHLTQGSDVLTAHLLAAAQESGRALPTTQLTKALDGLAAFVEGRIERRHWSPRPDEEPRRIAALAALARHDKATVRQLGTVDGRNLPNWPTSAVIDWLVLHQRMASAPDRAAQIAAAQNQLRSRLSFAGTTLRFVNEEGDAWWLMGSGDATAARAILALVDDPAWKEDLPRLVVGALARQERGAWFNTTANLWGALALEKFSARFESQAVKGRTEAKLATASATLDWTGKPGGGELRLPWPASGEATLSVQQSGEGKPWATIQALSAVPLKAPLNSGYTVKRTVTAVSQKAAPRWSRGDVMRVRLEVEAAADMSWVVLSDPLPTGAAVLEGTIDSQGERAEGEAWPDFIERSFSAWRAYFGYLPRGRHVLTYTVRLNNAGHFQMPTTRAEAMYSPDRFGELPNATLEVAP